MLVKILKYFYIAINHEIQSNGNIFMRIQVVDVIHIGYLANSSSITWFSSYWHIPGPTISCQLKHLILHKKKRRNIVNTDSGNDC